MNTANGEAMERDHSGNHQHGRNEVSDKDFSHINGWGADLDHKNRPAYPMERMPARLEGVPAGTPADQPINLKVYHSVERPGVTPVFGTSTPPTGLSGKIRDLAYNISENDIRRWLLLLFADRVNVVEGIGTDLLDGRVPNILSEMGIKAEWQHNPGGLVRKIAIGTAIAGAAYLLLRKRDDR